MSLGITDDEQLTGPCRREVLLDVSHTISQLTL